MKDKQLKVVKASEYRDHLLGQGFTSEELAENCYGQLVSWSKANKKFIPVMCGCGGSMYLCREHFLEFQPNSKRKKKKPLKTFDMPEDSTTSEEEMVLTN